MRLRSKVALITGGSRGIGRAMALAFAREGAKVAVGGVSDQHALTQVAHEIAALGEVPLALRADVSQKAEVDRLVHQVVERRGGDRAQVHN
jgi:3-oxoacyl-[acyl-carrier protein] reductase